MSIMNKFFKEVIILFPGTDNISVREMMGEQVIDTEEMQNLPFGKIIYRTVVKNERQPLEIGDIVVSPIE